MRSKLFIFLSVFLILTCNAYAEAHSYTVKGIIKKLPIGEGLHRSALMIKHQEIPNYVGEAGDIVGMHSMTMPFDLSAEVMLTDLQAGDCIEFTFDSFWKPKPKDIITKLNKISCDDLGL